MIEDAVRRSDILLLSYPGSSLQRIKICREQKLLAEELGLFGSGQKLGQGSCGMKQKQENA